MLVSVLTGVELESLLARRVREVSLQPHNAAILSRAFQRHAQTDYLTVPIDARTVEQARRLVHLYPLRALDAQQRASALVAALLIPEPMTFVASDRALLAAAEAEGLLVADPVQPAPHDTP